MQQAVFYVLTVLIWGSTWFAITFQLGETAETVSLYWRMGLAAALLLLWCLMRGINLRFRVVEHMAMALQGLLLFSLNYYVFYLCTAYIASGLVAVIFSTVIFMNIVNGAVFLGKPVRPLVLLAAVFGLAGIALVFLPEVANVANAARREEVWTGMGLGLIATYLASLGNILSARNQAAGLPVLQTNAWGMGYGALFMLLLALLKGDSHAVAWSTQYALALVYLSVFGSIIAFGAYLSLIGKIGADKAAYATVVFPIVALLISHWFEGFSWTWQSLVGIGLVLIGNVLIVGRRSIRGL